MSKQKNMVCLAQEYLEYRRQLGFKLRIEGQQLLKFAEYADLSGHRGPLTTELALCWARLPKQSSSLYQARRLEVVRCFAKYRAIFDPETMIPPKGLLGSAHRRVCPHIYSVEEILQLMEAARGLSPIAGLRPRTYATLFGLLASTGIRISEALRLERNNVDLKEGLLTILETKFHKSRMVALHVSVVEQLQEYVRFRDQYRVLVQSDAFFLSERGILKYSTVRNTFRTICRRLGWTVAEGGRRPRMYDLRHTFACRRLLQWYRDGVDIDHAIAALSTYMGHGKVTDTYWYITGIPELFQLAAHRFDQFVHFNEKGGSS